MFSKKLDPYLGPLEWKLSQQELDQGCRFVYFAQSWLSKKILCSLLPEWKPVNPEDWSARTRIARTGTGQIRDRILVDFWDKDVFQNFLLVRVNKHITVFVLLPWRVNRTFRRMKLFPNKVSFTVSWRLLTTLTVHLQSLLAAAVEANLKSEFRITNRRCRCRCRRESAWANALAHLRKYAKMRSRTIVVEPASVTRWLNYFWLFATMIIYPLKYFLPKCLGWKFCQIHLSSNKLP